MSSSLLAKTDAFLSDSDGQFPVKDIWRFYEQKDDFDVVLAWRTKRTDNFVRADRNFKRHFRDVR